MYVFQQRGIVETIISEQKQFAYDHRMSDLSCKKIFDKIKLSTPYKNYCTLEFNPLERNKFLLMCADQIIHKHNLPIFELQKP